MNDIESMPPKCQGCPYCGKMGDTTTTISVKIVESMLCQITQLNTANKERSD